VIESPEPDPHTHTSGDEAGGQMSGRVQEIAIADITIPPTKRALKEESVEQIMTSMPEFGLGGTPLTVYRGEEADKFVLITGGHRLEAARRLGGTVIAANIVDWEPDRRRMWEIVENLHRAELTELERAEQTVELIKLRERRAQKGQIANEADKPSQLATVSKGGRGKKGGIRGAARELGISKDDAHRSLKIDGLSEPAKQVARETGLDENRRVLLEATKAEDSVVFLREESARRDTSKKTKADPAPNTAEELADLMFPRFNHEEISTVISLLQANPLKDVVTALRNGDHVISKGWPGFEPRQPVDTTAHTGGAASQELEKEASRSLQIAISFGEGVAVVDGRAYVFDCDISIGDHNHHFDVPCPIEIGDFLSHAVARRIRRWLDRQKGGSTTPPTISDQTRQSAPAALASKSKITHKPRSRKSHG
jgi:ParB family chromosome partitioning protein